MSKDRQLQLLHYRARELQPDNHLNLGGHTKCAVLDPNDQILGSPHPKKYRLLDKVLTVSLELTHKRISTYSSHRVCFALLNPFTTKEKTDGVLMHARRKIVMNCKLRTKLITTKGDCSNLGKDIAGPQISSLSVIEIRLTTIQYPLSQSKSTIVNPGLFMAFPVLEKIFVTLEAAQEGLPPTSLPKQLL
eukprot:g82565.t1